jgi:hypothetical protein
MIDSNFIIRYTDGLYATPANFAPTFEEFRDMFSSGQLRSKEWAVRELQNLDIVSHQSVIVVGCWFGTLGVMLKDAFPDIKLSLLDKDPRCQIFLSHLGYFTLLKDMYDHTYTEDIVVNTSCEHIPDIKGWLSLLSPKTTVVLQTNNFVAGKDHVSCVHSLDKFKEQTGLKEILYAGELKTPMYTRFMIIGKV